MESRIQFYNQGKGWGIIENPIDPSDGYFFHISNIRGELEELISAKRYLDEPITFETRPSTVKSGKLEAININLDLRKRLVGNITEFANGFGWVEDFHSKKKYFLHFSKLRGSQQKFINVSIGDPVIFSPAVNEKGNEASDVVILDSRCELEYFAEFEDFDSSLNTLKSKAEQENWDYIKNPTGYSPVLFSFINYSFHRILAQNKLLHGKSSKDGYEYAYFNTGLVTPFQDEIYGYFKKLNIRQDLTKWQLKIPEYQFLEFETEQSKYRKYFSNSPELATYFSDAEITELVFDNSLNGGKIIVDREHILSRKTRFPTKIASLGDEEFFDAIAKSIELAIRRIKRNYKTAIPHFYDGKIQFLLPLCMLSKRDADLALVVNKEEMVYKAHTVLTLDQAYNNARLLAKPDREWLNP